MELKIILYKVALFDVNALTFCSNAMEDIYVSAKTGENLPFRGRQLLFEAKHTHLDALSHVILLLRGTGCWRCPLWV